MVSYDEELSAPRLTPKLEDHTLLAVRDCLLIVKKPKYFEIYLTEQFPLTMSA